jgi:hypothetical protein
MLAAALVSGGSADAQVTRRGSAENRLLREAAAQEARGDLPAAERSLRNLLRTDPTSSGAVFALERVLRSDGRTRAILPVADSFLAREPSSADVRALKLRVLLEVDSLEALRSAGDAWLGGNPGREAPYREVARLYGRAFGPDAALDVLRSGRSVLGEDALALEIGDLLAEGGDVDAAVTEWARALGSGLVGAAAVVGRIRDQAARAPEAGTRLVGILATSPARPPRRAGALVALELGLDDEALALSRSVAAELRGRERSDFLADVALAAREADATEAAAWAYGALRESSNEPQDRVGLDRDMAEMALGRGDTATAAEALHRMAAGLPPGSLERRRTWARALELEGSVTEPEQLGERLSAFRQEYPDAPELDGLAASVARGLYAQGDSAAAARMLQEVDGPRSALERGYLLLGRGDVEGGRMALLAAVEGLPADEATEVIQLIGLLQRLTPPGARLLAGASAAAHRGRSGEAVRSLVDGLQNMDAADRPALLAQAARYADRDRDAETAARLRTRILEEHPDGPEVAEASLALARYHARRPGGVPEAVRILEELIASRPNAAVVPSARVELERLRGPG